MREITQLGHRIKTACALAGMTQAECAERAGINVQTMTKIVRGTVTAPSFPLMCRIAQVTGISLDYLAGRTTQAVLSFEELA